jgi:hypothetical protein
MSDHRTCRGDLPGLSMLSEILRYFDIIMTECRGIRCDVRNGVDALEWLGVGDTT